MTLDAIGAMWLHPDRATYSRRVCTVELLYQDLPGSFEGLRSRFRQLLGKPTEIWLRLDKSPGQTLPRKDDWEARFYFAQFCRRVAADPDYRNARGLIIGNEPNLRAEGGISPRWVMTVVSGYGTGHDDPNNVFQQVRTVNPSIRVLVPPVGPWNAETDGELQTYPPPPDNRRGLMAWERYQSTLAWCAYHDSSHWTRDQVKFAIHTYSNVLGAGSNPANEPNIDLRNSDWSNAHYGIRVYDDMLYQIKAQAGGVNVDNLVAEWNSLVGGANRDVNDPAWPANNYPSGLMRNAVAYIAGKPNVLGFAAFVDDYRVTGCPEWGLTAATGYLGTPCASQSQRDRLQAWDRDFDQLLRDGWSALPTGPAAQGNDMQSGEVLNPGRSITSSNGRYVFIYQNDGNLVLYRAGTPLWSSGTAGTSIGICIMQTDGNLVIYSPGPQPAWDSGTWRYARSWLVVQDDGNVVIYTPSGMPVWATNTAGR